MFKQLKEITKNASDFVNRVSLKQINSHAEFLEEKADVENRLAKKQKFLDHYSK